MPEHYICRDRGMVYFRKRGCPKIRIRDPYGTPEFWARYAELLAKAKAGELKATPAGAPKPGTWRWLCAQYFASETGLLALDPTTQRMRRLALEATFAEPIAPDTPQYTFGDCPLENFTSDSVRILRKRKADVPEAANARLKAISRVFKWALEELPAYDRKRYGVTGNPTRDVARLKLKHQGGHQTWTVEEIEAFEKRWSVGTRAHLAMTLMLYCGGRRADVVALGKQHTHAGQEPPPQSRRRQYCDAGGPAARSRRQRGSGHHG
jgi:hypothetical protein